MSRSSSAGQRFQNENAYLYLALGGDLLVAAVKFVGAAVTGSSALFSEGVHSTVDAISEILLVYSLKLAHQPSTPTHQLGFGREIYFWNFIVALTILALGAGVALLDGIHQINRPVQPESQYISYGILLFSFVAELPALAGAVRNVNAKRRSSFVHFVRHNRDPTILTILFGGASGILGLVIAALGTFLSDRSGNPEWDGVASIFIAAILAVTALFLAANSKALLIGLPALPATVESILAIAAEHPVVAGANGAMTVQLAPDQILVSLSIAFRPAAVTAQIESAVVDIDQRVRASHPEIVALLLKPQSAEDYGIQRRRRGW